MLINEKTYATDVKLIVLCDSHGWLSLLEPPGPEHAHLSLHRYINIAGPLYCTSRRRSLGYLADFTEYGRGIWDAEAGRIDDARNTVVVVESPTETQGIYKREITGQQIDSVAAEKHNKLLDIALLDSMNTIPLGLSLSLPLYVRLKKIYDSLEKRVIKHVRLVTIVTFTGKPVVEPILVSIPNGGLRKFSFTRMNDDKTEIRTFTGNLQYLPGNLPYLQRDGEVVWFECSKVCKIAEVQ